MNMFKKLLIFVGVIMMFTGQGNLSSQQALNSAELATHSGDKVNFEQCPICLEALDSEGDTLGYFKPFQCKHNKFHGKCILQWLENGNGCPLCRSAGAHKILLKKTISLTDAAELFGSATLASTIVSGATAALIKVLFSDEYMTGGAIASGLITLAICGVDIVYHRRNILAFRALLSRDVYANSAIDS